MALSRDFEYLRTLCRRLAAKPRLKFYYEPRECDRQDARELWADIQRHGWDSVQRSN